MGISCTLRRALFLAFLPLLVSPLQCQGADTSADDLIGIAANLAEKAIAMVLKGKVSFDGFSGFPANMTTLEKARLLEQLLGESFLEHLADMPGDDLEGKLDIYLDDLKDGKGLNMKLLSRRSIVRFFQQISEKKIRDMFNPSNCKAPLEEGQLPEVRLGHSPIPTFGYPVFDDKTHTHYFDRKTSLNKVSGYPVPIKIGMYDYGIVGTPDQIKSFLSCFASYRVIGSTLAQDGHWYSDPEKSDVPLLPITIQVQGVMKTGSIVEILTRRVVSAILQRVSPDLLEEKHLVELLQAYAADEDVTVDMLITKHKHFRRVIHVVELLGQKSDKIQLFLQELKLAQTMGEKIKVLMKYLYAHVSAINTKHGQWLNGDFVKHSKKVSLTLTMYPRPANNVRATRVLNTNMVTLGDVSRVFDELTFKK